MYVLRVGPGPVGHRVLLERFGSAPGRGLRRGAELGIEDDEEGYEEGEDREHDTDEQQTGAPMHPPSSALSVRGPAGPGQSSMPVHRLACRETVRDARAFNHHGRNSGAGHP